MGAAHFPTSASVESHFFCFGRLISHSRRDWGSWFLSSVHYLVLVMDCDFFHCVIDFVHPSFCFVCRTFDFWRVVWVIQCDQTIYLVTTHKSWSLWSCFLLCSEIECKQAVYIFIYQPPISEIILEDYIVELCSFCIPVHEQSYNYTNTNITHTNVK